MGYVTDWVDAFASEPLAGNGCVVVHDAGNLTDEICIKFVRETSLSECTFLEPSKKADVKVRYFLASGEIPFAGHPTVATVLSLLHQGKIAGGPLTLETGAGIIPIRIDHSSGKPKVVMTQIAPEFGPVLDPKTIADCGRIEPTDIISPPQIVSTGIPFCISVVKDHSVLHKLKANPQATEIAKENGNYTIIETHSEHFILRIQKMLREKKISPNFVSINYVYLDEEGKGSKIDHMKLNENGKFINKWRHGFFNERLKEI